MAEKTLHGRCCPAGPVARRYPRWVPFAVVVGPRSVVAVFLGGTGFAGWPDSDRD
jgi:hypothetical protein